MDTSNNNASAGAATGAQRSPGAARRRRKLRKTLAGAFALVVGLTGPGFLANARTPDQNPATSQQDETALVQQGKEIYEVACMTCHGANLQGQECRGLSLIGVVEGSEYFQVQS